MFFFPTFFMFVFFMFVFLHGAAVYAMECRQCHALMLWLSPHLLGSGEYLGQLHILWNAGNVMHDIVASTPLLGFWGLCGAAAYAMECRQCHALTLWLPPHILIS